MQYKGLTQSQVKERFEKYGENTLKSDKKIKPLKIFAGQFKDFMVMILLFSTVLSVIMGETFEALTIIVIILLNATLGFIQEYKTEREVVLFFFFFLQVSCFFSDPMDVDNLISGSSAFSKPSLNIWNFTVHILLKPSLENF